MCALLCDLGESKRFRDGAVNLRESIHPGSFGSPSHDGVDGSAPIVGVVFKSFGHAFEFVLPYQGDGQVPECGKRLRFVSGAGATAVFEKSHVAHMVQGIFDAPMLARYLQKTLRWSRFKAETGYAIRRLLAGIAPTYDAKYLSHTRPFVQIAAKHGRGFKTSIFEATVPFFDRLVARHRLLPVQSFLRGKKSAKTPLRYLSQGWVGYPWRRRGNRHPWRI